MKTSIIYPGTSGPKHIGHASFKSGLVAIALLASSWVGAQTPTPATSTTRSTTQQPATQSDHGWTKFNEDVGNRLDLKGDQFQQLQEVDNRYNDRYTGMGATPWTDPNYKALTDQRNKDVQKILTPVQYDHWTTINGSTMPGQTPRPALGNTGTTTPPTGKSTTPPDRP